MAIRVAHVGTGNVGRLALIRLVTNPAFELTRLCVSSPEKVGKDAARLRAWTSRPEWRPSATLILVFKFRPNSR